MNQKSSHFMNIRKFDSRPDIVEGFKAEVEVISPGRINLIGEHTDYNNGFVMPCAIDRNIRLRFKENHSENYVRIYSKTFENGFEFKLDEPFPKTNSWADYIFGVLEQLQKRNLNLSGFECLIESDLPVGAGVSSSAALECGLASGINELFHFNLEKIDIVKLSQKAENEFVGNNCGIMDQYASVMSKRDHIIQLDCQDITSEYIPAEFGDYKLLLLNTNVSHNLADSEYNTRRQECEKAVEIIKRDYPNISSLRDADLEILNQSKEKLGEPLFQRASHVVSENQRVLDAAKALKISDFATFGKLMYESHYSLRDHYQVSCMELDFLVEHSEDHKFIYGARMMGGGFGGCTLNLIHKDKIEEYIEIVSEDYFNEFQIRLDAISVSPGVGTQISKTSIHGF